MPKINQEEYEQIKLLPDYDWNWIAREKTGKILSFTNKPTKADEVWKDKQTRLWFNYKDSQLFQFIQWEDEEPYNIAELIEEYEGEETEVKKDKEWLKDSINGRSSVTSRDLAGRKDGEHWKNENVVVNKGVIFHLIDQLDEPEVLSQEWIDKNKVARIDNLRKMTTSDVVIVEKLSNLLVPKQEEITHKQVEKYLLDKNIRVIDIDIYEEMQSELEGLKNGVTIPKTETVADVVTTFWKSYERLKGVMSMEVEELEE